MLLGLTLVVASRHREEERRSDPFITDSCKIKNGKLDEDSVHSILEYTAADGVVAQIYTRNITQQLALDLQRHNAQYRPIVIDAFPNAHDRFLCINDTVYHIGASLKDLGKKWFAFSRMEIGAEALRGKKCIANHLSI